MEFYQWFGASICLIHSALFSGLNLGFFGLSRLKLFIHADLGDKDAKRILSLRKDAHFLLSTLLWGNVASNVSLALIAESLLAGVWAFVFSTFVITLFGEIFPQAYFARHALKMSKFIVPIIRFYRMLLYPVAKPTGILLDKWLGKEKIIYFREEEIEVLLRRHAKSKLTNLAHLETLGAVNFLQIDDVSVENEGEILNPKSIIRLPVSKKGMPIFPKVEKDSEDPFLQSINMSEEKWVVITDESDNPLLVLNADQYLRDVMYKKQVRSIYRYCHRPILITQSGVKLGDVILKLKVHPETPEDDVVDNDIVLYWNKEKRIITGADILGRLLRGIVKRNKGFNKGK